MHFDLIDKVCVESYSRIQELFSFRNQYYWLRWISWALRHC